MERSSDIRISSYYLKRGLSVPEEVEHYLGEINILFQQGKKLDLFDAERLYRGRYFLDFSPDSKSQVIRILGSNFGLGDFPINNQDAQRYTKSIDACLKLTDFNIEPIECVKEFDQALKRDDLSGFLTPGTQIAKYTFDRFFGQVFAAVVFNKTATLVESQMVRSDTNSALRSALPMNVRTDLIEEMLKYYMGYSTSMQLHENSVLVVLPESHSEQRILDFRARGGVLYNRLLLPSSSVVIIED